MSIYVVEAQAVAGTSLETPQPIWVFKEMVKEISLVPEVLEKLGGRVPVVSKTKWDASKSRARWPEMKIEVAAGMTTVATACHEIAHLMMPSGKHAEEWRSTYCYLISIASSVSDGRRLAETFTRGGYPTILPGEVPIQGVALKLLVNRGEEEEAAIAKLRKIIELSRRGGTPEEAAAAASKAAEFATKKGLALLYNDETGVTFRAVDIAPGPLSGAITYLLSAVGESQMVKVVYSTTTRGRRAMLVGEQARIEATERIWTELLLEAWKFMADAEKDSKCKGASDVVAFRHSWLHGFADGFQSSVEASTEKAVEDSPGILPALRAAEAANNEFIAEKWGRVGKPRNVNISQRDAYSSGKTIGSNTRTTAPIPSVKAILR